MLRDELTDTVVALEQAARLLTAPLRRPRLHVHLGAPLYVGSEKAQALALALARSALTRAWCATARRLGGAVIPGASCPPGSDGPDAEVG